MEPENEIVPSFSIRILLMMENRLLREALIRLFRKRSDLVVVGHDGPADANVSQVLETEFDVLVIDSLQTTWPAAKIARETGGQAAFKAILIGMEPDEEQFMAAVRSGVMGYLLNDTSAADLVAAVRAVYRGEAVCPPQLCSSLFRFVAHVEQPQDLILQCVSSNWSHSSPRVSQTKKSHRALICPSLR
jgi:DNA-binding NarL/FixJ family response regulator